MSKKKTFWPYGIILSIFAIVCACVATIIFSSFYPVYEDEFYFDKYQNVKYDYEGIEKKQANFNKNFEVSFDSIKDTKKDERGRIFYILDKNLLFTIKPKLCDECEFAKDFSLANFSSSLLLTRPHTSKDNQHLELELIDNNKLGVTLGNLSQGRWQLKLKLQADDDNIGFFTFDFVI